MRLARAIDDLPPGSLIRLEGLLPVQPAEWKAITFEAEQSLERNTSKWQRWLINAGTLTAFATALAIVFSNSLPRWSSGPLAVAVILLWGVTLRT